MTSAVSSLDTEIESLGENVERMCAGESPSDMANGMKESFKRIVRAFRLVVTELGEVKQDTQNKSVALESSVRNELVGAAARIEKNEFVMKNELIAVANREQTTQQRIIAVEAAIKSYAPQVNRKPMSELRCASNLKNLGSDKSQFKNWNERLINIITQSLGAP